MSNSSNNDCSKCNEVNIKTKLVKCQSCGANMVFDPDKFKLYCSHCDSEQSIDTDSKASELDLISGFTDDEKWSQNETEVFVCSNCGAKVVFQEGESSNNCPFCGTSYVKKSEELAGLKPNAILPFRFGVEKALIIAKKWAKSKVFAPRRFKNNFNSKNLSGVYSPSFTFDSNTYSSYKGRLGETRTRVVGSGKNQRVETYTIWYNISGNLEFDFNDVLVNAGSKTNSKIIDRIKPFDTDNSLKYQDNFLLGYLAYHYDYSIDSCWDVAKSKIDTEIKKKILSKYHYDKIASLNISTTHERVTYKYIMLPIYIGVFTFNKKNYNYYINGENGKVFGNCPKSPLKIAFVILLILLFFAGIIAYGYFLQ